MNKQKFAKALFDFFCTQDCEDLNEQFKIYLCELDEQETDPVEEELMLKCEQLADELIRKAKS